ncbi:MAG: ankyrin repeat domain-containing protein [Sulfitobacter sp.]|nr:ankyrin repeat domain-containing protein [Sulfitobacter sp.]
MASLGPWGLAETLEYLALEYPDESSFADRSVRVLATSEDATLWATQLTEDERTKVPANVRAVAVAAGELLHRLDDLHDERPDAPVRLLASIDVHVPDIRESTLARVASDARSRLIDLQRAQLDATALNRQALAATDELRLLCAATWAEDSAHLAVEHERFDELERLLDAGWDVDDPTDDGMTLLHHAIDIEIDGATQTGEPLTAGLTELLVARGADLGHRWHGQTPLEAANERGHHLAVQVIEAAGHSGDLGDDTRGDAAPPWWAFWRQAGKP